MVNCNVNPCKMCMPMGTVTAFLGIAGCMNILHGSQGCSTYIRRHMATHYNEPVDVASSSLTEEGTVFGGEANLVKGLDNLIRQYDPSVVAVSTTCLAETIGENVPDMLARYRESRPECRTRIVQVSSAGYAGTQFEGWFRAVHALVAQVPMDGTPHDGINVVTGPISCADTRALKDLLAGAGLRFTLVPDISDTLDGRHAPEYSRLPRGGTGIEDISRMAGARGTLELSTFVDDSWSPGRLLQERHGVPLLRCPMPVGLRDADAFLKAIEGLGGTVGTRVRDDRGRFLDAMIDAHKYSALGRAAIFGEPDFAYGMTRLCCENGIVPMVVATGSHCPSLEKLLGEETRELAETMQLPPCRFLPFADFDAIENAVVETGANLLIGSSDGRRIAAKHALPLVRCAFPVHDHMGGQRVRILGFEGGTAMLDRLANALISRRDAQFRKTARDLHFRPLVEEEEMERPMAAGDARTGDGVDVARRNARRTLTHPCFTESSCRTAARIHLPVAPACNISCNYCVRSFDCVNESRPGVTSKVLSPREALERYLQVKARMPNLTVAGIAGPGDALANFKATRETLRLVREADPDVTFCLSTNGLLLPLHAQELCQLDVSHVTVTVNAVDPAIGARIYREVDYMGVRHEGEQGAAILMANQLAGIAMLVRAGVVCKVNVVMVKGVNDGHVEDIVRRVRGLGATIANIMQMIPVSGSVFEGMPLVSNKELTVLRKRCEGIMPQMHHCQHCRADAVGLLGEDRSAILFGGAASKPGPIVEKSEAQGPRKARRIAVASRSGVVVDQHFGFADQFYIYESDGSDTRLLEARHIGKGPGGCGMCGQGGGRGDGAKGLDAGKIAKALAAVSDCEAVLAMRIGESPRRQLADRGIAVFATCDDIDRAVREAATACNG
jgi:nitrogenase cofactor biosynthesis protein NifB